MDTCIASKVIEFDMGHRVPNHKSKCRNPHGHRYRLEAYVIGPIANDKGQSDAGMVMDFGDIKHVMNEVVHDVFDHSFVYYQLDEPMQRAFGQVQNEGFKVFAVDFIPTAENLARYFYNEIGKELPSGLTLYKVRLFETPNSWADYPRC